MFANWPLATFDRIDYLKMVRSASDFHVVDDRRLSQPFVLRLYSLPERSVWGRFSEEEIF